VPGTPAGIELTCTQTEYDAFGNVLRQISYDREDIMPPSSGAITGKAVPNTAGTYGAPGASNAIINYTYNWYGAATGYFGTNSSDNSFFTKRLGACV